MSIDQLEGVGEFGHVFRRSDTRIDMFCFSKDALEKLINVYPGTEDEPWEMYQPFEFANRVRRVGPVTLHVHLYSDNLETSLESLPIVKRENYQMCKAEVSIEKAKTLTGTMVRARDLTSKFWEVLDLNLVQVYSSSNDLESLLIVGYTRKTFKSYEWVLKCEKTGLTTTSPVVSVKLDKVDFPVEGRYQPGDVVLLECGRYRFRVLAIGSYEPIPHKSLTTFVEDYSNPTIVD